MKRMLNQVGKTLKEIVLLTAWSLSGASLTWGTVLTASKFACMASKEQHPNKNEADHDATVIHAQVIHLF